MSAPGEPPDEHPLAKRTGESLVRTEIAGFVTRAGLEWSPPVPWGRYGLLGWGTQRWGTESLRVAGVPRAICAWRRLGASEGRLEGLLLHREFTNTDTLRSLLLSVSNSLGQRGVESVSLTPSPEPEDWAAEALEEAGFYREPGGLTFRRSQSIPWRSRVQEPLIRGAVVAGLVSTPLLLGRPTAWVGLAWLAAMAGGSVLAGALEGWHERRAGSSLLQAVLGPLILIPTVFALFLQVRFTALGVLGQGSLGPVAASSLSALEDRWPGLLALGFGFGLATLRLASLDALAGAVGVLVALILAGIPYPSFMPVPILAFFVLIVDRFASGVARRRGLRVQVRRGTARGAPAAPPSTEAPLP